MLLLWVLVPYLVLCFYSVNWHLCHSHFYRFCGPVDCVRCEAAVWYALKPWAGGWLPFILTTVMKMIVSWVTYTWGRESSGLLTVWGKMFVLLFLLSLGRFIIKNNFWIKGRLLLINYLERIQRNYCYFSSGFGINQPGSWVLGQWGLFCDDSTCCHLDLSMFVPTGVSVAIFSESLIALSGNFKRHY